MNQQGRMLIPLLILSILSVFVPSEAASVRALGAAEKSSLAGFYVAKADGSYGSLEETYQAVLVASTLIGAPATAAETCSWLAHYKTSNGQECFQQLKASAVLNCPLSETAKVWKEYLVGQVQSASDLLGLYYPVKALALAKAEGWLTAEDIDKAAITGVLPKLKALSTSNGGWKYTVDEEGSSAKAAGLGLEVAASALEILGEAPSDESVLRSAASKLFASAGTADGGLLYFGASPSDVASGGGGLTAATAAVAKGVVSLASKMELKIGREKVLGLAKYLLSQNLPTAKADVFYLVDALGLLNDNSVLVPIIARLASPRASQTKKESLKLLVSGPLGPLPVPVKVTLRSATLAGSSKEVASGKVLASTGTGEYALGASVLPALGKYKLEFEVKPEDESLKKFTMGGSTLKVEAVLQGTISVKDAVFELIEDDSTISSVPLKFGKPLADPIEAAYKQKLKLSFKLTSGSGAGFLAQQALLTLSEEGGVSLTVVPTSTPAGVYSAELDFLKLMEKLYYVSGTYKLQLQLGDTAMENSVVWELGKLDLELPSKPDSAAKGPTPPKSLEELYGPMKEITHIMRPKETRPPFTISLLFTVLLLLPLFLFVGLIMSLKVNLQAFPTSGFPLIAAVGFHGGILAILGLYIMYFVKLSIFTMLQILLGLGIFTAIAGQPILAYVSDNAAKVKTA